MIPYPIGEGTAVGPGGDFYGPFTSVTIAGFQRWYLPIGDFLIFPCTNVGVEVNTSGATYSPFLTLSPLNGAYLSNPDGASVRLFNNNPLPQVIYYMQKK